MGLKISGLTELRERLKRLRPEEVMARALAEQAERMASRVRDGLSEPPGAAGHDEPWLQSGALRNSVGAQADGLQAVAGSSDPAAVPQEIGTVHMPARPFLAPVAAEMGEEVARVVGARVAAALRGEEEKDQAAGAPAGSGIVQVSADGMDLPRAAAVAIVLGAITLYARQQQEEARRARSGRAATPVPEMPRVVPPPTMMAAPPQDATNVDGAKAPGKPGAAEGFRDPKVGENWVPNPNGSGSGWQDADGNVWVPTGLGGRAHGGPHWDVQSPGGGYRNVYPGRNERPGR